MPRAVAGHSRQELAAVARLCLCFLLATHVCGLGDPEHERPHPVRQLQGPRPQGRPLQSRHLSGAGGSAAAVAKSGLRWRRRRAPDGGLRLRESVCVREWSVGVRERSSVVATRVLRSRIYFAGLPRLAWSNTRLQPSSLTAICWMLVCQDALTIPNILLEERQAELWPVCGAGATSAGLAAEAGSWVSKGSVWALRDCSFGRLPLVQQALNHAQKWSSESDSMSSRGF